MNPAPNQPPLRARVNSMTGPQNFTSPLAQIFQPLVVDDDLMEEDDNASEASSPPQNMGVHFPSPPGVSYGPASRRRLSSMHRPRMESGVRRFPILLITPLALLHVRKFLYQRLLQLTIALGCESSATILLDASDLAFVHAVTAFLPYPIQHDLPPLHHTDDTHANQLTGLSASRL